MKKFIIKAFLFASPFILAGMLFELLLFKTGESLPASKVLQLESDSTLYGRGIFSQQFNIYKYNKIKQLKPEILTLGSSTVLQFRAHMFHPLEKKFYNGGGIIQNVYDISEISKHFKDGRLPKPKVIIIGLDPHIIKKTSLNKNTWLTDAELTKEAAFNMDEHIISFRKLFSNPSSLLNFVKTSVSSSYLEKSQVLKSYDGIGYYSLANSSGFRSDGSKLYGNTYISFDKDKKYTDREIPPVIERIKKRTKQFSLPAEMDGGKLEIVYSSLLTLKNLGIEVYIFFPPYSNESLSEIKKAKDLSSWWNFYENKYYEELTKRGFKCQKILCPSYFGLDDTYMFDGFHPGEIFVGLILNEMIKEKYPNSYLKNIDISHLESLFKKPYNQLFMLKEF